MGKTSSCLEVADGTIDLYPHQVRVAQHVRSHRGLLCIHSTGTGKTLTSAAAAACLLLDGTVSRVVILAKKSAVAQFRAEVLRYWPDMPASALAVTTVVTFFNKHATDADPASTFLVVDEAHEFVNASGVVAQRVADFARRCKRVLLLTATPIVNAPQDLFVLTAMVKGVDVPDPQQTDAILASAARFKRWFAGIVDVHLIDKDADPHYPRKRVHQVPVVMTARTRSEYARQARAPAPFFINLRQLSLGFGDDCEKCDWLVDHVRRWIRDGQGKIVVYTAFIDRGARLIRKLLIDHGINVLTIDGSTSAADRRRSAVLFNKKPDQEAAERAEHRDLRNLVEDDVGVKTGQRCGDDGVLVTRVSTVAAKTDKKYAFTYYQGLPKPPTKPANPELTAYAESLKIPPAWSPAEVCASAGPTQKLSWVARDGKGNWQYHYSDDWNVQQEYRKILRLKDLDAAFWERFRARLRRDQASRDAATRSLAIAVDVLNTCHIRVGSRDVDDDDDDDDDGKKTNERHYGLTTLLKRHVKKTRRGSYAIEFVGKSGKVNRCDVDDPELVRQLDWLLSRDRDDDRLFGGKVDAVMVRRYLDELHPGLRPKDFRTYYANRELVRHLTADETSPLDMTPRQRSRRLGQAYRDVAKGLNNTPRVARDSYVFSGLWVLYLADPTRFHSVVANRGKNAPVEDVLRDFIRLFDRETIDWKAMLKWFKDTKGLAQFMGPAQVLLITDAGSESIDLAGTRHIVFMDPTWTPALENQIIGRGQRFGSHAHLSEDERFVDVWKLYLVKDKDRERKGDASVRVDHSVERYITHLSDAKREEQTALYRRLAALG